MGQEFSSHKVNGTGATLPNQIGEQKQLSWKFGKISDLLEHGFERRFKFSIDEQGQVPFTDWEICVSGYGDTFCVKASIRGNLENEANKLMYRLHVKAVTWLGICVAEVGSGENVLMNVENCPIATVEFNKLQIDNVAAHNLQDDNGLLQFNLTFFSKEKRSTYEKNKAKLTNKTALKSAKEREIPKARRKTDNIKLVSREGQRFPALRSVLIARSNYFKAIFNSNRHEARTGVVKMHLLSSAGVEFLLKFINGEEIFGRHAALANPKELLAAAKKYELFDLLQYLDAKMTENVSERNALSLLKLANKYCLTVLKIKIQGILENHPTIFRKVMDAY